MNPQKIHIGILGTASIAVRSIIPTILSLKERFQLIGIASRDLSKAISFANSFQCEAYQNYEDLLKDGAIDAVYIPLPNSLHNKYVQMALDLGKHVLVEKSLGCNLAEVNEMNSKARTKSLVLLENFQFRKHSQFQKIINLVNDGIIGELRLSRVAFGFPPFPDPNNIRYDPELGGGALLDAGAYALKIAPYFLGENIFVSQATMSKDYLGVDLWGSGVIGQKDGALTCQFGFGFDNSYQCSLELWGSLGKLSTNRIFTAPPHYCPKLLIEKAGTIDEQTLSKDDHFINMLNYFYELINGSSDREIEYRGNLMQGELIDQFKNLARDKQIC